MADPAAYDDLRKTTNDFLSGIEKEVREKDRYGSSRDHSSRRSARHDDYPSGGGDDDDRYSSSRRKRDAYDDAADYDRDRDRRRSRRDRDYDDDHRSSRRRDDDYYGGGEHAAGADDYYSRSSRSRRDRDDGYGSYGGRSRAERSRYDSYDDDFYRSSRSGARGGGGGDGADWRNSGPRDSSPTPKRSPTPEGTIPLSERPRPFTKWDIPAPGFEGTPAMAAKATGLFGIPGQSRILGGPMGPMGPPSGPGFHLHGPPGMHGMHHGMYSPPGGPGGPQLHHGGGGGMPRHPMQPMPMGPHGGPHGGPLRGMPQRPDPQQDPQAAANRQARRLYIGNITHEATESNLCGFFNEKMREIKLTTEEGDPCVSAQVNPDKGYAFLEFRNPEEATNAMSFDGIVFQTQSLKIRRPKDYVGPDIRPPPNVHVPGVISTNVPDSPNKIFVGGLPTYLTDEQVIELLQSFGELRAFNLVKEGGTGASKGFAFCEYVDPALTDLACQGLNDMELADRRLVVQRASVGSEKRHQHNPAGTGANAGPLGAGGFKHLPPSLRNFAGNGGDAGEPTSCIVMLNMVTPEELQDDEEYADIVEDIRDECSKYGDVLDVRIPRPAKKSKGAAAQSWRRTQDAAAAANGPGEEEREGVGRVYVRYDRVDECAAALKAIAGRQFGGRLVICAYLKESDWPSDEDGGQNAEATAAQASGPAAEAAEIAPSAPASAAEAQTQAGPEAAQAGANGQAPQPQDDDGEADMTMGDDD
ncbi:hypothetical protein ACQY0O_003850 [Thecaphora frezii]